MSSVPEPVSHPSLPVPEGIKTVGRVTADAPLICARNVNVHYGDKHAIREVNIDIARNQVLAMIGPSGIWSRHCAMILALCRSSSIRTQ